MVERLRQHEGAAIHIHRHVSTPKTSRIVLSQSWEWLNVRDSMRGLSSIYRHFSTPKIPELFISELGVVECWRQLEGAVIHL